MRKFLGIELGSTRIKAVLVDENFAPIASGAHNLENKFEGGFWTYGLDDAWAGIQDAYAKLAADFCDKYGEPPANLDGIGISAMMHGYLVFDGEDNPLVPFRTWRNTTTEQAAETLTKEFGFNIPQRWSIAHLYQAYLNKEEHVKDIRFLTTLAGYVHWKLTGRKVVGVGEGSGIMPLDTATNAYDAAMVKRFGGLSGIGLSDILPEVLNAGENAGVLTADGAKLLDPSGVLQPGAVFCPPEGDAGTGMVATNSVKERTGNISAGTSVFAMLVLEKPLSKVYPEIDMVTTPTGKPVAMVHCNSCTSDLDAWVNLFAETLESAGAEISKPDLYDMLYFKALEGDPDCGGLFACNYISGEPITGIVEGRPLFARIPGSRFTLANFMRAHLFSAMATLKLGMDILAEENVRFDTLTGHGGLFKTEGVGQRLMAAALNAPVAVGATAGEGGAWGIALLAAFAGMKNPGETLEGFLSGRVFANSAIKTAVPDGRDVEGFGVFMERYKAGLEIERAAAAINR